MINRRRISDTTQSTYDLRFEFEDVPDEMGLIAHATAFPL